MVKIDTMQDCALMRVSNHAMFTPHIEYFVRENKFPLLSLRDAPPPKKCSFSLDFVHKGGGGGTFSEPNCLVFLVERVGAYQIQKLRFAKILGELGYTKVFQQFDFLKSVPKDPKIFWNFWNTFVNPN